MTMRKALEMVVEIADREWGAFRETPAMKEMRDVCTSALSAPSRNCDVGTADEQADRYLRFCRASKPRVATCDGCPLANTNAALCEFTWSQMPYDEQEGGAT